MQGGFFYRDLSLSVFRDITPFLAIPNFVTVPDGLLRIILNRLVTMLEPARLMILLVMTGTRILESVVLFLELGKSVGNACILLMYGKNCKT